MTGPASGCGPAKGKRGRTQPRLRKPFGAFLNARVCSIKSKRPLRIRADDVPVGYYNIKDVMFDYNLLADGRREPSTKMIGDVVSPLCVAAFLIANKAFALLPIFPTSTTT